MINKRFLQCSKNIGRIKSYISLTEINSSIILWINPSIRISRNLVFVVLQRDSRVERVNLFNGKSTWAANATNDSHCSSCTNSSKLRMMNRLQCLVEKVIETRDVCDLYAQPIILLLTSTHLQILFANIHKRLDVCALRSMCLASYTLACYLIY